jgi:hypothetical protein
MYLLCEGTDTVCSESTGTTGINRQFDIGSDLPWYLGGATESTVFKYGQTGTVPGT